VARPTLTTHRKFRRLARLLGGQAVARGTLELLWDVAYAAGEARIGDALDVEEAAQWQGEAGKCVAALVDCGFLDADTDGETFTVHDLFDHAPQYVRRRFEREQARKQPQMASQRLATGASMSSTPARAHAPAPNTQHTHALPAAGTPLGARREHLSHACCGRVCLPAVLYTEFVRLHGGDEPTARAYVSAFFKAHDPPASAGPIGDDAFTFWRRTWAAHHPSVAPDARTITQAQRRHAGAAAEAAFLAAKGDG